MLLRSFRPVTNNYIWKLKNKANFVCKSGHIQHYRHFSTEEKPDHDDNTGFMSLVQKNKNKIMLGAGVTGGAVTIYGITSILYNVTTSMMTLTPITSLYYGFLGGAAVATIGSSCIVASRKLRYIHPETAWQKAFYYVNTSDMVRKKLGEIHLYNSEIVKSYRLE